MMSARHRNVLNQNRLMIVRNLQVTDLLLTALQQDYTLTQEMREEIAAKSISSEKASKLLDILAKRGPNAFDRFIYALVETDQDNIAKKLDDSAAHKYIGERDADRHQNSFGPQQSRQLPGSAIPRQRTDLQMPGQQMTFQEQLMFQQSMIIQQLLHQNASTLGWSPNAGFSPNSGTAGRQQNAGVPESEQPFAPSGGPSGVEEQESHSSGTSHKSMDSWRESQHEDMETGKTASGLVVGQPSDDANDMDSDVAPGKSKVDGGEECGSEMKVDYRNTACNMERQPEASARESNIPESCAAEKCWNDTPMETIIEELNRDPEMRIDVVKVKSLKRLKDKDVYSVEHRMRGRAVIISNTKFDNPSAGKRDGAEYDESNLERLFKNLQFDTVVYRNLSAKLIRDCLTQESANEGHWKADMFVLFILTHGRRGSIQGVDGQEVEIDAITEMFDGHHCPALKDKPKAFFIQACQGDQTTAAGAAFGVNVRPGDGVDAPDTNPIDWTADDYRRLQNLRLESALDFVHEKADTLVSYATAQGYRAWRRSDMGSWFVRCIVYVFSNFAHVQHLSDLLTKVNSILSHLETTGTDQRYRQIAEKKDTLRKNLYFFPGYTG